MDRIFRKVERGIEEIFGGEKHSHTHGIDDCSGDHDESHANTRYQSFAPQSSGHAKWYVDGCSYFWAVSEAIEAARETIYILDWWLSPEVFLRRPPARNAQYRLDNMLEAAAKRGVQVKIIVYKEVPQALTLNSAHTKHRLEDLHPNIRVFRHPDHLPSGRDLHADLTTSFANLNLNAFGLSKLGKDTITSLYGTSDDVVLFWAHHEKLCLIDSHVAFMGGLDMCFGRYDTNSHPIADAHPDNLDNIIFPGQDYNNARVYDFEDVDKWENNKLDRTKSSRMGWSDISISLSGPIVSSLLIHFTDRWNFIYSQKYVNRQDEGYAPLDPPPSHAPPSQGLISGGDEVFRDIHQHFNRHMHRFFGGDGEEEQQRHETSGGEGAHVQLCRSCTKWSQGVKTEHSIANAYIAAITNAQHFVYIENQFFITAVSDEQHPVDNKIGKAIVDRIVRAHQAAEEFRVTILMPAVPAFAGDLQSDGALGTRAIMEFQYNSINRGGHSIIESLRQAGIPDPSRYIGFYNLRNFDRINVSPAMRRAEQESGVSYESARKEFDEAAESGADQYGREPTHGRLGDQYERYQQAADKIQDQTWDTISACYMNAGPDLGAVPWTGSPEAELNAFVSEELYIHSKVLIADDRLVICGSANLNDRSQLGTHDSEIAVVIEDPTPVRTTMRGAPFVAGRFAASLRRQLFRKHLGLLPDQRWDRPDANFSPVTKEPNAYDWDSPADRLVEDPMSDNFLRLWANTARLNTEAFSDVFHNVPNDRVRNWDQYQDFFSRHFVIPGAEAKDENGQPLPTEGKVDYGHVVPGYPGGLQAVKEKLGTIRGNLVEMPLDFLIEVDDIAKEGLSLNSFTDELYT